MLEDLYRRRLCPRCFLAFGRIRSEVPAHDSNFGLMPVQGSPNLSNFNGPHVAPEAAG